jgi:protein-S-isoprenylcysteine O-methyltransferase Ste14
MDDDTSGATPHSRGLVLVALQFALLAALAWQAVAALHRATPPAGALACITAGVALGLWALTANRPGNFNIRPQPREGGRLIEQGPYRWIRHPMYSALLLAGLGVAWLAGSAIAWTALAALAVVLLLKARIEEAAMSRAHAGYVAYRQRTKRFVPGLW